MLEPEVLQLSDEAVQDLHARGQEAHAEAVEAIIRVATAALTGQWPGIPREYFTVAQAAGALSVPRAALERWLAAGELRAVHVGDQTLLQREALREWGDRLRARKEPAPDPTPDETGARRRHHEELIAALPPDTVARLEALHDKLETVGRLTRAERREMVSLERDVAAAAAAELERRISQKRSVDA